MRTRALGSTGFAISEIVLGAGAVGGGVFRGAPAERRALVARALELGANWVDTAPLYGNGASEENLGWILEELRAAPYISTKVRLNEGQLEHIGEAIRDSLRESLGRLRRTRVELIQLHNAIGRDRDALRGMLSLEDVLGPGGVAEAFDELCREGLVRAGGFTALGEVDALHEVVASGRFDTAQVYHNLLNPSAARPVPAAFSALNYRELAGEAHRRGMGVLNIRVLAAGIIGGQEPRGRALSPGSEPSVDAQRTAALAGALRGEPGTLAQQAIRFALDQPSISAVLVGFTTIAQVEEAVEATNLPSLSAAAVTRLEGLYARDFGPEPQGL